MNNEITDSSPSISPSDLIINSFDPTDENDEEIDQGFICCVCLDLLYKPIVLACGHISCFWCVHHAMNGVAESHCPICRSPYGHFPAICQLLHFVLLKIYPVAYKRREKQILEEEEKQGCFSPQFGNELPCSHTSNLLNVSEGTCDDMEATKTLCIEENNVKCEAYELLSRKDALCAACKQLLFQPAVLNCGHVYCQSCISTIVDEALRCQVCQSLHPKGRLKVCRELDHLLEKKFPEEYAQRKEALQPIHDQQELDGREDQKKFAAAVDLNPLLSIGPHAIKVHMGVGCDYCGMYPIHGNRYKCKDCVEDIGFDLCGDCYNTSSKLPGRFNQQHTPEHKFDLVQSKPIDDFMRRVLFEFSEDSSVPVHSDDASEDLEDGLHGGGGGSEDQEEDSHLQSEDTNSEELL
ncbi:hypothetical protein ACHQM5_027873 [Ranunculus cassubicifolius]